MLPANQNNEGAHQPAATVVSPNSFSPNGKPPLRGIQDGGKQDTSPKRLQNHISRIPVSSDSLHLQKSTKMIT